MDISGSEDQVFVEHRPSAEHRAAKRQPNCVQSHLDTLRYYLPDLPIHKAIQESSYYVVDPTVHPGI